jgi:hypothetical protein
MARGLAAPRGACQHIIMQLVMLASSERAISESGALYVSTSMCGNGFRRFLRPHEPKV